MVILNGGFHGFPQSLQVDIGMAALLIKCMAQINMKHCCLSFVELKDIPDGVMILFE
jgi:hypothetical protein